MLQWDYFTFWGYHESYTIRSLHWLIKIIILYAKCTTQGLKCRSTKSSTGN